ncbi:hypothetical protein [Zoogloea sp.]|jgi:putative transposase|uniref:hypothetical protein n=1 Tax=Zoogloea sp. TaxID=49181 RepID=UPI0035AFF803
MIEDKRSFGYRTVAHLMGFNKNTVQMVFSCASGKYASFQWGFDPEPRYGAQGKSAYYNMP